jgi:hypothetical protein
MKLKTNIDNLTISREEAIIRTTLWREKFMETFAGSGPSDVFRGFLIPIEDIKDIASKFPDGDITHVRAYVSAQPQPDDEQKVTLSILLVPAGADEKDVLKRVDEQGVEKSTIYDFTQPCPPCCDVSSPLHGDVSSDVE